MAFVSEVIQFIAGVRAVVAGTPRTAASVNAGLSDLASRTKWLNERLYQLLLGAPLTISAANTVSDQLTVTGHSIPANTAVQVFATNGGALPCGLAVGTVYYVDVIDADTIALSATSGPGAAVDLTAGFVGDCYVQIIPDWLSTLLIADATYGAGKLTSLVMFLAGAQTVSGAKTFADITVSGTNKYKVTSRGVSRAARGLWYLSDNSAFASNGFNATVGQQWQVDLDIPNGATLTKVTVTVDPGAHASLPAVPPTIRIDKYTIASDGAVGVTSNQDDPTTPAASYAALHSFDSAACSEVINNATCKYVAVFIQESGANSATGRVVGLTWTATVTSQDDGAS